MKVLSPLWYSLQDHSAPTLMGMHAKVHLRIRKLGWHVCKWQNRE